MTVDPCSRCEDLNRCGGRPQHSRILPKGSKLGLSVYEKRVGEKGYHPAQIVNEVGLYVPDVYSGDACRVLQEYELEGEKLLRLGYYIRNPDDKKWRWAQFAQILEEDELKELLRRAKSSGIINF